MDSQKLRVLIVDDSAIYRQTLSNIMRGIASIEVVGHAKNGTDAIQKMVDLDPDAITLDYEMPDIDGIKVLRRMRRRGIRAKAIMVSSYTTEGARVTTDALLEGAFDFLLKPSKGTPDQNREQLKVALLERLSLVADSIGGSLVAAEHESVDEDVQPQKGCEAVVIGASTGGPVALRQVLSELPGDLSVPVIIVQHMPQQFTATLARRLDDICQLDVVETTEGGRVRPGAVYVAAGGKHTKLTRRDKHIVTHLSDDPPENSCRPAIDYTLRSASEVFGGRVLAVILTGMGRDGAKGCEVLKKAGGRVFAQHPDGCTVYGMPKSVIEAKLSDKVIPLSRIAKAIRQTTRRS